MTVDHYSKSGRRWAAGATLVYGPIAAALVDRCPHPLAGRVVLDAGAGTGVASTALAACGARPVAVDFSADMLTWDAESRPPAAVADLCALPLVGNAVDDGVAAFVLNHLADPAPGFAELMRVIRPGGAFLACVYSTASHSEARDRVDEAARAEGWVVPEWYVAMKATAAPVLGHAASMAAAAERAGLVDVVVDEVPVDVGITRPEQLVDYRFGQAHFADWLDAIDPHRAAAIRDRVAAAVRPVMRPYHPIVVFLAARIRRRG